jgi:predicted SAM-dependent methyltransferase
MVIAQERREDATALSRLRRLAAECRRLLRPGAGMRSSTPDVQVGVTQYLAGEIPEWSHKGLRRWGHPDHVPLAGLETRPDHGDLIVAATA